MRLTLARHNTALDGFSSRIEFVLTGSRSFATRMPVGILNTTSCKIDVVLPPTLYTTQAVYPLSIIFQPSISSTAVS